MVFPKPPGGRWPPPTLPMWFPYGPVDLSAGCRFELKINGEHKATTGIIGSGLLSIDLHWVGRMPKGLSDTQSKSTPRTDRALFDSQELLIQMGGLDHIGGSDAYFTSHKQSLKIADEIIINILPPGPIGSATGYDYFDRR